MGVNSLPKTVTRQRRDCDLNPGPSAPESSTLTTRLPSHPRFQVGGVEKQKCASEPTPTQEVTRWQTNATIGVLPRWPEMPEIAFVTD